MLGQVSLNDYKGLSYYLPINGCQIGCNFCFNKELWNRKNKPLGEYIKTIEKIKTLINTFVLSGADILATENLKSLTIPVSQYLKENGQNIIWYINIKSLKSNIIKYINKYPDLLELTINNIEDMDYDFYNEIKNLDCPVNIRYIYTKKTKDLYMSKFKYKVDILVLDKDYPELYSEAISVAKKYKIPLLSSQVNGAENVF